MWRLWGIYMKHYQKLGEILGFRGTNKKGFKMIYIHI